MKRLILGVVCLTAVQGMAARPYRGGAVAAAHPAASQAAVEMLGKGGNAVDAAVAAAFVMGVVGPYHSGIGGGGFALVHLAEEAKTRVLDFREVAPKAAHRDMYLQEGKLVPGLSTDGALAVAVPGAARGYLELLAAHGKLKPQVVLAPAIRAAKEGFWVTPKYRELAEKRVECLRKDEEARRIFLRPDEGGVYQAPALGTVLTQPELAKTLEAMAKKGAEAFYTGPVAEAVASTVKAAGGVLTAQDLADYRTTWREPLEGNYRGHRILTMPPPSAGGVAILQVLGGLETLGQMGEGGLPSREVYVLHRYIESLRRSYVDRARYLGDPAFTEIPLEKLVSRDYVSEMVASIDPTRATSSQSLVPAAPGKIEGKVDPKEEKKNTTHLSVIDEDGNAVSLTTTVNYWFGSCVVAKGTGVLLNDQMDDFAAQPMVPNTYGLVTGEANAIAPGKIPLSSMSPTLVFSKPYPSRVMLAVGSPGGSTIPTTVIQVISNVVDGKMDPVRAVGYGRVHHQWMPDVVMVDRFALEPSTRKALEAMGHTFKVSDGWGDAEAVFRDPLTGLFTAGSDPRNEGFSTGPD